MCALAHLRSTSPPTGQAKAASDGLQATAQLLLPQLLRTYHATLHPEDRACLLALRALDKVLSPPSSERDAVHSVGFMSNIAFVWGGLWALVQDTADVTPDLVRMQACRPDIIDPRSVAFLPRIPCAMHNVF